MWGAYTLHKAKITYRIIITKFSNHVQWLNNNYVHHIDTAAEQLKYKQKLQSSAADFDRRYPHDVNHVNFIFSSFFGAHN